MSRAANVQVIYVTVDNVTVPIKTSTDEAFTLEKNEPFFWLDD